MGIGLRKLRVVDGDYTVEVRSGGTITLNVGSESAGGQVRITGDLLVEGITTTIETQNMVIEDNIIVLNKAETGPGVTLGQAGIEIERGSLDNAQILFDESVDHFDPVSFSQPYGTFVFSTGGTITGIRTNSIDTAGGDLALINQGNGVLTVEGTSNYENQVVSDDHIPNLRYLLNYVAATGGIAIVDRFYSFDPVGATYYNTGGRAYDTQKGDPASKIVFEVDGVTKTEVTNFGLEVDSNLRVNDILINDNYIKTTSSNANLQLAANGTGTIQTDSILQIINQASDPSSEVGYLKLYPKTPGTGVGTPGKTGLYFVNTLTTDELVAKNRALLFSILF